MEQRDLNDSAEALHYFDAPTVEVDASLESDEGSRELGELSPFVISGGSNTERFYFKHISRFTPYKFNVIPEYFGDESNYTEVFPARISEILSKNTDAKIFCVFDWDTIAGDNTKEAKHKSFIKKIEPAITQGAVVICETMPCIEYWFLLHFENCTQRLDSYSKVSNKLAPYLKPYFLDPDCSKKIAFKKLMKAEKYLSNSAWVEKLCADNKLELAIKRAEENIQQAEADKTLDTVSYSYVFKLFKES